MRPPLLATCLAMAALTGVPAAALAVDTPTNRTLYADGPTGRYLIDGAWLFRLDRSNLGLRARYHRQTGTGGWSPVQVPNAWNAGDDSNGSMKGSIGWYRKDFKLPETAAALDWAARFESVNYRATVWLNGREVGGNTGAYLPFSVRLDGVRRTGTNRLVIRVDSRRRPTDFPPSSTSSTGAPSGGWWNYGGLLREVYLQRLDTVELKTVSVVPRLSCRTCAATVPIRLQLRNLSSRSQRVSVTADYGGTRVNVGTRTLRKGSTGRLSRSFRIASPQLWSPASPYLYPVSIAVRAGGRQVAGYTLHSGIRSIKVAGGRLTLNGSPVSLRGVGLHEDSRAQGFAVDNAWRDQLVANAKDLGATVLRTHYPLSPYLHELADREGLLIWSEIPVFQFKTKYLQSARVRARGAALIRKNVQTNLNHPSVMLWSVGNEMSSRPEAGQGAYIKAAAAAARAVDSTRPVAIAVAGYPQVGCQSEYRPLDVVGFNDYFGWYPGPSGRIFDQTKLSAYLDYVRACYRSKAIMVTEFGAEANREGPAEEKGTWAFQQDFVNYHLNVFATKPWLSGALYWALNEFRVKPDWEGGNPRPAPPVHQKGLITYDGARKPAFSAVQSWYRQTPQIAGAAAN